MVDAMERLDKCAEGAAIATGTTVTGELKTAIHERIPNLTLARLVHDNYAAFGKMDLTAEEDAFIRTLQENAGYTQTGLVWNEVPPATLDGGVSDNSEYSWFAPTAMFRPAILPGPMHHWTITATSGSGIGRKTVGYAAKILANSAVDLIANPEVLDRAKAELAERLGGRTYECLIPESVTPPVEANKETMAKYFKF